MPSIMTNNNDNIDTISLKKRKLSELDDTYINEKITKTVNLNSIDIPNYTDEESDEEDSDEKGSDEEDDQHIKNPKDSKTTKETDPEISADSSSEEKKEIDPKYALFYKRFQSAARNIALTAYNIEGTKDSFGNVQAVKALPLDAAEDIDADADVRAVIQRREAEAIPQGLVPLPVPDLNEFNEGEGGNDNIFDETGTPNLVQLRKQISKPMADTLAGGFSSWLAHPIHVSSTIQIPFDHIEGLSQKIKSSIKNRLGHENAFAVQATLLPPLLAAIADISPDPRPDILVNAATGSGKTLAYAIPIVQALSQRVVPHLRAIVLLPTRPLITQVASVFQTLSHSLTKIHVMSLHGDHSLRGEQERLLKHVPDIIVSTPGRLVDHIRLGTVSLRHLQYLVVDESDRLLNDSFNEWATIITREIDETNNEKLTKDNTTKTDEVGSLLKNLRTRKWSRPVQKLIFSATLTRDPGKLALLRIRDPQVYIIGGEIENKITKTGFNDLHNNGITDKSVQTNGREFAVPYTLTERLVPIQSISVKPLRLMQLIASHQGHTKGINDNTMRSHVIVFVNSNEAAARLARLLTLLDEEIFHLGLVYQRCSGEQPTSVRRRVLRAFAETNSSNASSKNINQRPENPINVLVCTDLVARGIDISDVRNVINYDIPRGPREYVHRVGRTARAGKEGTAWSFAADRHDHGRFWRGISAYIYREGKSNKNPDIDISNGQNFSGNLQHDDDGDVDMDERTYDLSSIVEKYELEEMVPKQDTRDHERIEEGYKRALQRLEKEVNGS